MNKRAREIDILTIIEKLDISPSMYKNATDKYNSIANYLNSHGLNADIYPQGSFALGTVIRPYSEDRERRYDLDFVCQVSSLRKDISAKELRETVEDVLKSGDLYGGKLHISDECITIEYADINNVGFSIDIVPAIDERPDVKEVLKRISERPELIETSIRIPKYSNGEKYKWLTNNPKGYKQWFLEINAPFESCSGEFFCEHYYMSNRCEFNSVEEIPEDLHRSSLQRVIQILKYHRDVYFSHITNGAVVKPISAIVNTIVTGIAANVRPDISIFELLRYVLEELSLYEGILNDRNLFRRNNPLRQIIQRNENGWIIQNPANPGDNLANEWNENKSIPIYFFKWIKACNTQLLLSMDLPDEEFRSNIENAFGQFVVQKHWGQKYSSESPKPISYSGYAKPWRKK